MHNYLLIVSIKGFESSLEKAVLFFMSSNKYSLYKKIGGGTTEKNPYRHAHLI